MKKDILITGMAGAGKTSLCEYLNNKGHKAIDLESVEGLFSTVDQQTGQIENGHDNADLEAVKRHDWICQPAELKKLVDRNKDDVVFYAASASNLDELLSLFDKVFLLKITEATMRQRLSNRSTNDFGRTKEVQDWMCTWKDWWEDDMTKKGAIQIDGSGSLAKIVDQLLLHLS